MNEEPTRSEAGDGSSPGSGQFGTKIQVIGSYRILREIGRGGQGVVYLAEDQRLGRKVALKVMTGLTSVSDAELKRFHREAEVASRLDHHSICTVYEAGIEGGIPFIAMQYVEGETLSRKISDALQAPERGADTFIDLSEISPEEPAEDAPEVDPSPTPTRQITRGDLMRVVALIEKAARALHTAHEVGVIHRDIKPGNIVITPAGDPVILDFGLARELEGDLMTLTATGEVFGTPAYMAPEQISNQGEKPDARADLYSLGVVLYECLTLRRPFEAPNHQALFQSILNRDPPDPRTLNATITQDLKVVLETVLDKSRDRRYQTALAFAEDLRRVRVHEPITARPIGRITRVIRMAQRHPVSASSIAAAAIVIVIGVAFGSYVLGLANAERKEKEKVAGERDDALTELNQAEQERDRLKAMMDGLKAQNRTVLPQQLSLPLFTVGDLESARATPDFAEDSRTEGIAMRGAPPKPELRLLGEESPPPPSRAPVVFTSEGGEGGLSNLSLRRAFQEFMITIDTPSDVKGGGVVHVVELEKVGAQLKVLTQGLRPEDRKYAAAVFARLGDKFRQVAGQDASADQAYASSQQLYAESGQQSSAAAVALSRAQSLRAAGQYEEAARELGEALEIFMSAGNRVGVATVSQNRGTLYGMIGQNEAAMEDLDRAQKIHEDMGNEQDLVVVLCNKGILLQREGKYEESCEILEKGHAIGSQNSEWAPESKQLLDQARQVMTMARSVPHLLTAKSSTKAKVKSALLAELALRQGKNLAAAQLFGQVLTKASGSLRLGLGLRAAQAAALTALGVGDQARGLPESERKEWRKRALGWFQTELASFAQQKPARGMAKFLLKRSLKSLCNAPALAPLRDADALSSLSEEERKSWTKVWQDLRLICERR